MRSTARIALVLLTALILVPVLQRILGPIINVAIREQMHGEPEIEIKKRVETLRHVIYRTLIVVVVAIALVTILPEFGVNAAALIAGLGLLGLAVGFGAQNLVKDIINGIFILAENQYGVGDVVTVCGITGIVEDLNLRRTVLRDLDGTVHSIGHGQVDTASNWTKTYSRVNLDVRVSYRSNLDHAIEVINRVGKELAEDAAFKDRIIDPPHVLRVECFSESAIELKIIGDTAPIEQWGVMGELRLRIKKAFDAEGIEIPLPQRVIHIASATTARGEHFVPEARSARVPVKPPRGDGPNEVKVHDGDGDPR